MQGGDEMEDLAGIPQVGMLQPCHAPAPHAISTGTTCTVCLVCLTHPCHCYTPTPAKLNAMAPYSIQWCHSSILEPWHCGPVPRIPVLNSFAGETPLFHRTRMGDHLPGLLLG
jgi:hypothetical protein